MMSVQTKKGGLLALFKLKKHLLGYPPFHQHGSPMMFEEVMPQIGVQLDLCTK